MRVLTVECRALADDFSANYEEAGCCCHQPPPCGYCTHEGHPESLAEHEANWVEMLEPMCKEQEQILLGDNTPALKHGKLYLVANNQANKDKILLQYGLGSYTFVEELICVMLVDLCVIA